jgi:hypothetical protein
MVLAWPVPWEVGGCLVADDFGANLQLLYWSEQMYEAIFPVAYIPSGAPARLRLVQSFLRCCDEIWCFLRGVTTSNFFDGRRAKDCIAPGPTRCELNWYHHRCTETPLQRHALSSPLYTPLRPPTGTQSETTPRCPPPLRVWPAKPPAGSV